MDRWPAALPLVANADASKGVPELSRPLKMVHPARSSNSRAQWPKSSSKISQKWSIQHAWPVKDAMARAGVVIEA